MRVFGNVLWFIIGVWLMGCQTLTSELPSSSIFPLTSPIEIGQVPVKQAHQTVTTRATFSQGGQQGYVEQVMESLVDFSSSASGLKLSVVVQDANASFNNMAGNSELGAALDAMKGMELVITQETSFGETNISVNGKSVNSTQEQQVKGFGDILKKAFIGGRKLSQGEEVFNFSLGDFLGKEKDSDAIFAVRVIGQSTYNERPVVVLKTIGTVEGFNIDGIAYHDTFTGVAMFGKTTVEGKDKNGMGIKIVQISRVVF